MLRNACLLLTCVVACGLAWPVLAQEITDLAEAKADPDFSIQGEYVGERNLRDGGKEKVAVQLVARGDGEFEVLALMGGLPGAGWKRGDETLSTYGEIEGDTMTFDEPDVTAKIADGKMTIVSAEGAEVAQLTRTERKSPTLGAKPPAGAEVLFDGSNVDQFEGGKLSKDKSLFSGVTSKATFNDCKIHLEFCLSWMPKARGQGRSNSGVYVHDCYEIQVLDSFGLDGRDNECGGFYGIREPDVNMCFPPLTWQTFDIDFAAPKYEGDKKVANARITVRHNGVVIHDDVELERATPGRQPEGPGPRPIHLQGHGNKVQYRNIWVERK